MIATLHYDLIEPNWNTLKCPEGTHYMVYFFTKKQLKSDLGRVPERSVTAGNKEDLKKVLYFDINRNVLNVEDVERVLSPMFA